MKWNLPLWSAFAVITIISLFFLLSPDYDLDYIIRYNLAMWCICSFIYIGESAYKKVKGGGMK